MDSNTMKKPEKPKNNSNVYKFPPRPVDVALKMMDELKQFEKTRDRSVFIKALKEQFLITRMDAANLVEKNRTAALEILVNRLSNMSDSVLLRTIETLSNIGAVDMQAITGSGKPGHPLIAIQQNSGSLSQSRVSMEGNPVKDTGQLLESLEHLANYFRGKPEILK
jgi:hypothetical protein